MPAQVRDDDDRASKSELGDLDDELLEEEVKKEEIELLSVEHLEKMYVFALVWGMGALLETSDRSKFDEFLRTKCTQLDIPVNSSKTPDVSKPYRRHILPPIYSSQLSYHS